MRYLWKPYYKVLVAFPVLVVAIVVNGITYHTRNIGISPWLKQLQENRIQSLHIPSYMAGTSCWQSRLGVPLVGGLLQVPSSLHLFVR